jgi:hypothetical protein
MPAGIRHAHLKNPCGAVNAAGTPFVCRAMKRDP